MLADRSKESVISVSQQAAEKVAAGVDPSWKSLYKVGGISAILYIVLALVVPTLQVLTMKYFSQTADYGGAEFLGFIAENRLWWLIAQTLLLGSSILIFSLVMLKGVFHKSIAYLGIVTCAAVFIAMSLWPIVGVGYFWWWTFFFVWFIAVGWKLYQLGKK